MDTKEDIIDKSVFDNKIDPESEDPESEDPESEDPESEDSSSDELNSEEANLKARSKLDHLRKLAESKPKLVEIPKEEETKKESIDYKNVKLKLFKFELPEEFFDLYHLLEKSKNEDWNPEQLLKAYQEQNLYGIKADSKETENFGFEQFCLILEAQKIIFLWNLTDPYLCDFAIAELKPKTIRNLTFSGLECLDEFDEYSTNIYFNYQDLYKSINDSFSDVNVCLKRVTKIILKYLHDSNRNILNKNISKIGDLFVIRFEYEKGNIREVNTTIFRIKTKIPYSYFQKLIE